MPSVTLYSSNRCPYAHRTRLTLTAKGVEFERVEIDLDNKPDNFHEISPYGKVPVLVVGSDRIWESAIINEYIDEVFPNPPLLPTLPGERAIARIWIDFVNTKLTTAFYKLLLAQNPAHQDQWREELHHHCRFLETEALQPDQPYILGDTLSLVDISVYPWLERWSAIAAHRQFPLPDDCPRLQRWFHTLQQNPTIQTWQNDPAQYVEDYRRYANNTATSTTAQELRQT
ncbi:glutathione S-transferase family protein [Spirulina major]|uniref:glutathione S-transferase family protein n=1 Tax=Spirulina major TaxID=270636 RepID=UPI00093339E3|nr:glutathione S-transferase family protein [Spirulina major]